MKRVVVATVLAAASAISLSQYATAQQPVNMGQGSGEIQLPAAEANAFNSAVSQADPKGQAAALESFLSQYPNTTVKAAALEQLLQDYVALNDPKVIPTADNLLKVDPNNVRALTMETFAHSLQGQNAADPAQKQSELDTAAGFAQKGITALNTPPKGMSADDFAKLKASALPVFYGAIGSAALNKKDAATAIDAYKKELAAVPEAATAQPGPQLGDTFQLGDAYRLAAATDPKDFVLCAYYAARAGTIAPEPYKTPMLKEAQYCYQKWHGKLDGFDAVPPIAVAHLNPPADFIIAPAPTPPEIAHDALKDSAPASLAMDDREFILQNGSMTDAAGVKDSDKVWAVMKGKSFTIPDAIVVAATPTQLQVAVSQDAQLNKVADVTVTIKPMEAPAEPKAKTAAALKAYKAAQAEYAAYQAATAVNGKVTFQATYDSYATSPFMITMIDGEVQVPKAAAPAHAAPAGRPGPARRPAARK